MTDLSQTPAPQHKPKPTEEEEEEEEYTPAVRPHRYIYKYHRVGTASLEKIAGPATTPATTSEKNAPTESTSLFAENSHMMTMIPETLAHEMVTAGRKLATALSDGEIPLGNSLGVSHSEIHAEPAAISPLTTNLTDGIDLGGAVSVEETSIYAHHGEDVVANFDYVSPDAAFTLQLTSGDSAATLPLSHEAAPQEGISRVVSGVSQDNVPFISGIVSVGPDLLQCTHGGTQRVINGVTSEKMEILGGLSTVVAGQQQIPGKEAWEDAPKHISKDSLPQSFASLENQEFHQEDSTSRHTTQQDFVPKELLHKRDICSVIEVVSGVTSENIAVVSGLSSISPHSDFDLKCPKDGKEFELPSIKVVVSGITADGVEVISGLLSEHGAATASSECGKSSEIRAESHSGDAANVRNIGGLTASPAATLQVVSGLTSDNQQIIAGIAMNVSKLHEASRYQAGIPFVEVQKAPDLTAGGLQSEYSQGPLHPSNLPPVDVPMRSDSF